MSNNGWYQLIYQDDGNLVVYTTTDKKTALWSSGTQGKSVGKVVMQLDGNLVVYGPGGTTSKDAHWGSGTVQNKNAKLFLQDDGKLGIYDSRGKAGKALWQTQSEDEYRAVTSCTIL